MVSNAQITKKLRQSDGLVLAPDMERPVVSLADNIQKAMAALYNLHMALLNALGVTNPLLDQFRRSRDAFRSECDNLMLFLQHCHGHAEDYVSLCQFTLTRKPSECWAFFSDIFVGAKKLSGEADEIRVAHEKGYKELRRNRSKLMATFTRTLPPSPTVGRSRVSERRRASLDAPTGQFLQTARAALRPDGLQSVSASYLNLQDIGTSLRDIVAFWDDHVAYLAAISEKRVELIRPKAETLKSVESWTRYQSVLLAAISSISESSDAVMVDPVGVPNAPPFSSRSVPRLDPGPDPRSDPRKAAQERRSFWDRIWELLEHLVARIR